MSQCYTIVWHLWRILPFSYKVFYKKKKKQKHLYNMFVCLRIYKDYFVQVGQETPQTPRRKNGIVWYGGLLHQYYLIPRQ